MLIKNKNAQLNDELLFLITCCRLDPSDLELNSDTPVVKTKEGCEDIEFIHSILDDQLDTKALLGLATQHGILPLIYKSLKKLHINDQEHFIKDLKSSYIQIAKRNMLMSAELIHIMKLLEKNNIVALAFKGPSLAQMAYGDITLRQYGDLDILVDEKDLFNAGELIASRNYIPDAEIDFLKNESLINVSSDLGFRHAKNNTYIELHWKLFRKKLSITLDGLSIRSNPTVIKIQGKEIKTLQSDLLLVYLCAHGSKHIWERIEWVVDIDKLIRNIDTIDWGAVWQYAKAMHTINTLLLGLSLCQELFRTPLPDNIVNEINKRDNIQLLKVHTLQLLNNDLSEKNSTSSTMFKKFDYHSKLYDSFGDKIQYYFSTLFKITPDDVLNINLPKHLSFLYFIMRPFRLTKKYLKK